ncbi:MAG: hypothetical protein DRH04_10920 [Deltaproteobacteria bacterium]|nr:MAG: hypothetical protein DRH04_10920 [Deltaproteobacteria bacterium]
MAGSITGAGSGFVFWLIAARLYSSADVGIASAVISALRLVTMLSILGLDIGVIRYLAHERDRNGMLNTCLTIVLLASLLFASVFLAGLDIWSPSLADLLDQGLMIPFVIFAAAMSLSNFLGQGAFVAFRNTRHSFIQNLVSLIRIGILPLLVAFSAFGIFLSFGIGMVAAFAVGLVLLGRYAYKPRFAIKRRVVNDMIHYSAGNYMARIFEYLPNFVLPIMVVNMLGAEENAYFFIAWATAMFLLMIPRTTSMSLLAEGSYVRDELRKNVIRSLKFIFILLIPAVLGIVLFGDFILGFFGSEYSDNAFDMLRVLALACIPFSLNSVYATVKRVQKDVWQVICVYGGIAVVTLVAGYVLMGEFGLIGVGYAWVVGNGVVSIGIGVRMVQR